MKFCILMGSPKQKGNTAELTKPFIAELKANGAQVGCITLADKNILPCKGCNACQNIEKEYGCVQKDDVFLVIEQMIAADFIVFATPIYTWYCTAPMKALLDRHYGLNKFYGAAKGSLWAKKNIALITTHGYEREYAASSFETGIIRLCEHSDLNYCGMLSARDIDGLRDFQTEEVKKSSRDFARKLLAILESQK